MKKDIIKLYSENFDIISISEKTNYSHYNVRNILSWLNKQKCKYTIICECRVE